MRDGTTRLGVERLKDGYIGAGGFVTGISFAADGSKMIRTDTYNGYFAGPGTSITWDMQIKPGINCDADSLYHFWTADGSNAEPWFSGGTFDVAIAPSNAAVRYLVAMGSVWVTQDAGVTYTKCSMATKLYVEPNTNNRLAKSMVVDPQNPAICWWSAPDGTWFTTNYGSTWTQVSTGTLPAPTPTWARTNIAFDPSSSVSGGKKQGIYLFINGRGLYHSTNAGTSWSKITDRPTQPTNCCHMKIGSDGQVYLAGKDTFATTTDPEAGQFSRYDGTWHEPAGVSFKTIAVSPHNAGHVYGAGPGGGLAVSTDYGVTWPDPTYTNARSSPQIPWHSFTTEAYMTNGDMEFDPVSNRIWVVEGIGVWYLDSPPTSVPGYGLSVTWKSCSLGIENMVCFAGQFSPTGNFGIAIGDRACMAWTQPRVGKNYPATHGLTVGPIQNGDGVDFPPEDPNFCVAATSNCGAVNWSADCGETWNPVTTLESVPGANGIGGNVAAFTKDKWILVESNNGKVWRTNDRGATWTRCIIGQDLSTQYWHRYVYTARRILVRDRYVANRAYIYNHGPGDNSDPDADRGVWRTDDAGVTWTLIYAGYIIGFGADFYHGKLTQYDADTLLWCGGDNALGLWRLTNLGGGTNTAVKAEVTGTDDILGAAHFAETYGVGIGKSAYGSSYPTVLVCAYRMVTPQNAEAIHDSSGWGTWISYDGMVTWKRVARYIGGVYDFITGVEGDPSKFGRFMILGGGSGCYLIDYDYTLRAS